MSSALKRESEEHEMYATIRRYEGVDESRSVEITKKASENLIPVSASCRASAVTSCSSPRMAY